MGKCANKIFNAMREEYCKTYKLLQNKSEELNEVEEQINSKYFEDHYPDEYSRLANRKIHLQDEINNIGFELDAWSTAKKICLDIIDQENSKTIKSHEIVEEW